MKKVLLSVALLAGAFTLSFAQQKNIKEAKRIANSNNPDFAQAEKLINESLVSEETKNDPEAWDIAGLIQKRFIEEEQKKQYLKQSYDTVGVYSSVAKLVDYYAKCDELAQIPNAKGKVKNKFRKSNATTIMQFRPELINGGVYYFNHSKDKEALDYFLKYLESASMDIFEGNDLVSEDANFKTIAYYATLAAMRIEDYATIEKTAPMAVDTTKEGMQSLEILTYAYKNLKKDAEFLATLKEGMEKFPEHMYFFGSLVDYYVNKEQLDEALALATDMVAKNPDNSYYVYVEGFINHHKKDYAAAAASFKKAIAIDPENAEAYSNLGLVYTIQAQGILDSIPVDMDINDSEYIAKTGEAIQLYKEALPFYVKARELKPDNKDLWLQGLYLIYYKLGMEEIEEIEALM
ncbi:tetratricopeptide repeat protein [Bacteroides propionicifaciens]|uniref:tetratricopeptide repeat protein n=1 Tax=Bacteroides propionicifaciens TaxID=392838 RepID=UPI00035FE481|nr:tetratricopeptide repeat protein [Bacteroides propionicifaciens]